MIPDEQDCTDYDYDEDVRDSDYPEDNPSEEDLANLSTLSAYLRTVPPENFDYEKWGETGAACGTVACALGHAVLGPFNDRGVTLEPRYPPYGAAESEAMALGFDKDGDYITPDNVIALLFGDGQQVNMLFYPELGFPRKDPVAVADRIDDYVAKYR